MSGRSRQLPAKAEHPVVLLLFEISSSLEIDELAALKQHRFLTVMISNQMTNQNKWGRKLQHKKQTPSF
jgi:hypothetical protein